MRTGGRLIASIFVTTLLAGCDSATDIVGPVDVTPSGQSGQVVGSGNVVSQSRNVSGFQAVSLAGIGRLILVQSGTESLTITADDNILPLLMSDVRGGTLFLGFASDTNVTDTQPIVFELSVRTLTGLTATGAVEVDASGIDTDRLDITISGASTVSAVGRADRQDLVISGACTYLAEELESRVVSLDVSGASRVVVNVSDELRGRVSGASTVIYIGDPVVDVDAPLGTVQQQ